jgi:autotransporter family porin
MASTASASIGGALSITATGKVTATAGQGILASVDSFEGGALTIKTAAVEGSANGVLARSYGAGDLSITATGTVTGTAGDGIYAFKYHYGGDLTIEAGAVTGGTTGIKATNNGTGILSITTTSGTVTATGTTGTGILASNVAGTTGITIDVKAVTGGAYGIKATNNGTGILSITAMGDATVDVAGAKFTSRNDRLWGGVGLGGTYNWNQDKYSLFGEGSANTALADFGDSYILKGTLGVKIKW